MLILKKPNGMTFISHIEEGVPPMAKILHGCWQYYFLMEEDFKDLYQVTDPQERKAILDDVLDFLDSDNA
jgi:hypothetical protein